MKSVVVFVVCLVLAVEAEFVEDSEIQNAEMAVLEAMSEQLNDDQSMDFQNQMQYPMQDTIKSFPEYTNSEIENAEEENADPFLDQLDDDVLKAFNEHLQSLPEDRNKRWLGLILPQVKPAFCLLRCNFKKCCGKGACACKK